jgi:hypothetical protein
VLADTHAPRRWRRCPPSVARYLRGADLILHAGDVCTADVLDELSAYAPVRAVRGNNDGADVAEWGAPDTLEWDLAGLAVAMVHDGGRPQAGALGSAASSRPRNWSCSGIPTFRSTRLPTESGSSIPGPQPTVAASLTAHSASCTSTTAASSRPGSSR